MRILISGSRSILGAALTQALTGRHDVATLDRATESEDDHPTYSGDVRDRDFAAAASAGQDVIIQLLPPPGSATAIDVLDAATRGTYNLVTTTSATRFILLSSLRMFERYPASWLINEYWAPQPSTDVADLAPYLAEATLREASRVLPIKAITLRLGDVVDEAAVRHGLADEHALHVEDAVQAVERALTFEPLANGPSTGWWVFHIPSPHFPLGMAGTAAFGYAPQHTFTPKPDAPRPQGSITSRDSLRDQVGGAARRVVIFGAGGPLAAATTDALAHDHILRLTDIRPLAGIVAQPADQGPHAPVPPGLDAPHETRIVDVADPDQVLAAARGMDAIINCTVLREDPVQAFRVNVIGAYNVMRAAVACGIRRVVHTGPYQLELRYPAGYWYDYGVGADVPARPGTDLYILTKFLGQEICRIFAEEHDLEVPTLLFCKFVNPASAQPDALGLFPFSVSWEDAAAAMRQALRAPSFPHPFEVLHILTDQPHGKFTNEKAKSLLNWQPRDSLEQFWQRDGDHGGDSHSA